MTLLAATLWLASIASGLGWMWNYASTPGVTGPPPANWPADSLVERARGRPCLLVFMHPRCPCSRATVRELAGVVAGMAGKVSTQVLFYHPSGTDVAWARTSLWDAAAAIPGVCVAGDEGGAEAARFHATVSGQAMLFDADGGCRFSGGMTPSRGHEGGNVGSASLRALLRDEPPPAAAAPVFGCGLACHDPLPENESARASAPTP